MQGSGSRSSRRSFLALACGSLAAIARAEVGGTVPRVVFFNEGHGFDPEWRVQLRARMVSRFASHGLVDGRNVAVDYVEVVKDEAEHRAREIANSRPRVICTQHVDLFLRLAPEIPIVFYHVFDPVKAGFVASLRRPDGIVTGVSMGGMELMGKRFELLKEIRPGARRIAALSSSPDGVIAEFQPFASRLGLELVPVRVQPLDSAGLAQAIRRTRADAFISYGVLLEGESWAQLQRSSGVPGLFLEDRVVDKGGFASLGPSFNEEIDRAVDIAARILRGEKPGSIAVDQMPPRLTINLATARAMGIPIPASVMLRADRTIP